MNGETKLEMFEHLFDTEIFSLEVENDEINFFCLAEKRDGEIKLMVLLNNDANEKASATEIDLLNKIADFKDYHLSREEVVVLNLAHQRVSLKQLKKKFAPANIICFGIDPAEIGLQIDFKVNQLIHFHGVNFVFTSSLHEISGNEKLKKQFFLEALKPMFSSHN